MLSRVYCAEEGCSVYYVLKYVQGAKAYGAVGTEYLASYLVYWVLHTVLGTGCSLQIWQYTEHCAHTNSTSRRMLRTADKATCC